MSATQNVTRATFVVLLIASLVVSVCRQGIAADDFTLPSKAEDISPLQVGDRAPAFTVRTVEDEPYDFDPDNLERPTILISLDRKSVV